MLIEHLSRPTTHPVALIYSARSVDEFAFRAELAALRDRPEAHDLFHRHARREKSNGRDDEAASAKRC